jgi:hypothetical protein
MNPLVIGALLLSFGVPLSFFGSVNDDSRAGIISCIIGIALSIIGGALFTLYYIGMVMEALHGL